VGLADFFTAKMQWVRRRGDWFKGIGFLREKDV